MKSKLQSSNGLRKTGAGVWVLVLAIGIFPGCFVRPVGPPQYGHRGRPPVTYPSHRWEEHRDRDHHDQRRDHDRHDDEDHYRR
jgi:hypothetical protein